MPFTFHALNEDNTVNDAEISITLTPTAAIFTETNWVGGSSDTQIINVEMPLQSVISYPQIGLQLQVIPCKMPACWRKSWILQ